MIKLNAILKSQIRQYSKAIFFCIFVFVLFSTEEPLTIELLQLCLEGEEIAGERRPGLGERSGRLLALLETSAQRFLYPQPHPHLVPRLSQDRELFLQKTNEFPVRLLVVGLF